jgi:hypothetical protein
MSRLGTQTSTGKLTYTDTVDDLKNEVFPNIPDRPTLKLMTFDELKTKISRRGKGPKRRQHTYQALKDQLETVERTLANATLETLDKYEGGTEQFKKDFQEQLDDLTSALTTYQKRHKGKKARRVQSLHDEIKGLGESMESVLKNLESHKGIEDYPQNMRVDHVLRLKPEQLKGVCFTHCQFDRYNTSQEKPPPKEVLGKGAVNEVMQINYSDGAHVFKEEKTKEEREFLAPTLIGIDLKNDLRCGNRNVATGLVGELLGTPVLDPCTFAIMDDKVGLLMKKAPGKSPKKWGEKAEEGDPTPLDNLSPKALASLQKQMMDLEVCDLITGQVDRHYDNYLIDVKGNEVTVKGIDNDFAFGNTNFGGIPVKGMGCFNIRNLPKLMDSKMAEKIRNLDFDTDVAPQFEGLLMDDEIAAAKERLQALQAHVGVLDNTNCIVENWETWRSNPGGLTVQQFLAPENNDDKSSYFARDLHKFL